MYLVNDKDNNSSMALYKSAKSPHASLEILYDVSILHSCRKSR